MSEASRCGATATVERELLRRIGHTAITRLDKASGVQGFIVLISTVLLQQHATNFGRLACLLRITTEKYFTQKGKEWSFKMLCNAPHLIFLTVRGQLKHRLRVQHEYAEHHQEHQQKLQNASLFA